jgi:hypothetical protein
VRLLCQCRLRVPSEAGAAEYPEHLLDCSLWYESDWPDLTHHSCPIWWPCKVILAGSDDEPMPETGTERERGREGEGGWISALPAGVDRDEAERFRRRMFQYVEEIVDVGAHRYSSG